MKLVFRVLILSVFGFSWNGYVAAISCPASVSSLDEASRDKILETVNRDRELIRRGELSLTNGAYALQGAFMQNLTWDCNVEAKVAEMTQSMCNGSYGGALSVFEVPYNTYLTDYYKIGSPVNDIVNSWTSSASFNASTFLQLETDTRYINNIRQFTASYLSDVGKTIGCAVYECPNRNWTRLMCKTSPSIDMNETIYVPGNPTVVTTPVPEPVCSVPGTLLTSAHRTKLVNGINEKRAQALNGTLKLFDGTFALQAKQMPMLTWDCEMEAKMNAVVGTRCVKSSTRIQQNESTWSDNERYNTIDYYVHEFSKTNIDGISLKSLSNNTFGTLLYLNLIDQRALHDKATKFGCAIRQCDFTSGTKIYPSTMMVCTFDVNWQPIVNGSRVKVYNELSTVPTTIDPVTTTPTLPTTTTASITTPSIEESTGCTTTYNDVTTSDQPQKANCSEGYVYFEPTHSCYGRDPEIGLAWNTFPKAEQYCEKQGGHLASIHSEEENKLIVSLGAPYGWSVWVGLYSIDENYTWKWSDATPLDYLPWFHGYDHPLYPDVNRSCVRANPYYDPNGSLVNDFCSSEQYYVCQLPAQN